MKKKLIIFHPFKLKKNDYLRLELDFLEKEFDIEIHEMIEITQKNKKLVTKEEFSFHNTLRFKNFNTWKVHMSKRILLESKKKKKLIVWISAINYDLLFIRCLFFLKKNNITTFRFWNGTLVFYFSTLKKKLSISSIYIKVKNTFFSLTFFKNRIRSHFFSKIFSFFMLDTNFILVSGPKNIDYIEKIKSKNTKILKINNWDYSLSLRNNNYFTNKKDYAIFVADPGPGNISDWEYFASKNAETESIYYPLINNFFDYIEKNFNLEVIIASHPVSTKDNQYFKNRKVISGQLNNLVKNSSFLMTKYSSAFSYGVIYKKPMIFFYTNELKKFPSHISIVKNIASTLGTEAININNTYSVDYLNSILKINDDLYNKFLDDYLVSEKNISNYKIIINNFNKDRV